MKEEDARDSGVLFSIQEKSCENNRVDSGKRKLPIKTKAGNMPGTAQKVLTSVTVA